MSFLRGIVATAVTPFDEREELNEAAFVAQVRYLVSAGVDGISVGGSTGEGAILSDDELTRLCKLAVDEAHGKVPVVAGVIRNSTKDAQGSIVAPSAIIPELLVAQWRAFLAKDYNTCVDLHHRILPIAQAIAGVNFPGKIKEAIRQLGRSVGIPRSPGQMPTGIGETEHQIRFGSRGCHLVRDTWI